MKAVFYNIYKVFRSIVVFGIVTFVTVFVLLYLLLLVPSVQDEVKDLAQTELSKLLHTNVNIDRLSIEPFNKVVLHDVEIPDQQGKQLLNVDKIGAGFSVYNFFLRGRVVFTYAELIGLDGKIYKDNAQSEANIQFIIDALSPKDKTKPPTKFDLSIYNIVLRKSALSYDLLSDTSSVDGFNANHISIRDLRADIAIPRLKNEDFNIIVKRLSFEEQCGFAVKNFTVKTRINNNEISVADFKLELPNSSISTDDFAIEINGLKDLKKDISSIEWNINMPDSYLALSDVSCFLPQFSEIDDVLNLSLSINGTLEKLELPKINIYSDNDLLTLVANGELYGLDSDSLSCDLNRIYLKARGADIVKLASNFTKVSQQARNVLCNIGTFVIDGSLIGSQADCNFRGKLSTAVGKLSLDGNFANSCCVQKFNGDVSADNLMLGKLLSQPVLLGETSFTAKVNGSKNASGLSGSVVGNVNYFDFKGYRYSNISTNLNADSKGYSAEVKVADKNLKLFAEGAASLKEIEKHINFRLSVGEFNLARTNLNNKYPSHNISFDIEAESRGDISENLNGEIVLRDLCYKDSVGNGLELDRLLIKADSRNNPNVINLESDILNGQLKGDYNFKTIVPVLKGIIADVYPSLFENQGHNKELSGVKNNFNYAFNVESNETTRAFLDFFKLPITIPYPVALNGFVNETSRSFLLDLNAPYLAQKKKLIEGSRITIGVDSTDSEMKMDIATKMPTKKGKMSLLLKGRGKNNRLNTNLGWVVDRKEAYHGNVDLSIGIGRVNETNSLMSTIDVKPTTMVFNDTTWHVHNSKIGIYNKTIRVDDFRVTSDNQFIWIDGRSSADNQDEIKIELKDINLDYIFETLQINNVTFGGKATGRILASSVLSKAPKLETESFFVKDMTYNSSLLGDADMKSFWNNEKKYVAIQALITQPNGLKSDVDGEIYPMNDSLRFDFRAEKLKVGFMKPFLAAFTSDIDGYATGYARLYGKFRNVNLYGDIYAEDLKIKVDYTNVYYWANDSIKLKPGYISFDEVELKDRNGHTAILTGHVSHNNFRDASYRFDVTEAKDFLCYDIPEKKLDNWYGTIYGNGSAFIEGEPGLVKIDVGMATAANSKFFFELSDSEDALEYNFITFTDKRKAEREAELLLSKSKQELILKEFEQEQAQTNTISSRVVLNIKADINPLGQLVLIMDPAGGDKIKATGSGTLTMVYDSNGDLEMRGKYTLEKGMYNFTLQDIILKDFTIKEGSSIAFDGDPYSAKIDIAAVYALNANLQDLDEAFATDKELNRTNVPVHALLNVTGSIASPELNFDLEFPTLSSDAYRKVKSIVSTDDMMNRQIIYLLALNRFYTPEYMGNSNKGNELASVASSTISSQLTSMLGQISDKWSIAPNFKSDRGDFSDVEVNLALSSQLLNNRLLLNGNFGYRDKMTTASNSNFIGDFDIEYLLNKAGNIRLKAYNHFNDQNYYVKNALTTQGVGVVFKYDFDRLFRSTKRKSNKLSLNVDSINTSNKQSGDSIMLVK